jgi:hypothetical protein
MPKQAKPEYTPTDCINIVYRYRKFNGDHPHWSELDVSKACGVPRSTLYAWLVRVAKPRPDANLEALDKFLKGQGYD